MKSSCNTPELVPHFIVSIESILLPHFSSFVPYFTVSTFIPQSVVTLSKHILLFLLLSHISECSSTDVYRWSPQHGEIRLVAAPHNGEGAIEFYHNSFGWSGICPDNSGWGTSEAIVACRQLGYETGRAVTYTR